MTLIAKDTASVAKEMGITLGGLPIDVRLPTMAEENEKLRFAIAVFYDVERLLGALRDFQGLGLTSDDLWLAGEQPALQTGSALYDALVADDSDITTLVERLAPLDETGGSPALLATQGPALEVLQTSMWQSGVSCLDGLLGGDIGGILRDHAQKGAVITGAKTATAALQDECVRVLLRRSLHMVYSRECRYRASPGRRPRA